MICDDTSQVGGPNLIFDHQMCIDVSKRTIYVFGGRILTPRNVDELTSEPAYSGLFSFHIGTNTWSQILVDVQHATASNPEVMTIKSRVTHSMVFHHVSYSLIWVPMKLPGLKFDCQINLFNFIAATPQTVYIWWATEQGIRYGIYIIRCRYTKFIRY